MAKESKPKTTDTESTEENEEEGVNFMEILNNPLAKELFGGCKDLFKKEKPNPNICEITIKAPSEVVLKLFKISEER